MFLVVVDAHSRYGYPEVERMSSTSPEETIETQPSKQQWATAQIKKVCQ